MKAGLTRIAVVLDRSGSMSSSRESTIAGINQFIRDQKQQPGSARLKFAQFDDTYEVVFDRDLRDVRELTQEDFIPRGSTALYDAVGRTIQVLGAELAGTPESARPEHVIVVIMTDGLENSSHEYKLSDISRLVDQQSRIYSWKFLFLGANQDAVMTAQHMSIPRGQAITYNTMNAMAVGGTIGAASAYTSNLRSTGQSISFSDEQRRQAIQK